MPKKKKLIYDPNAQLGYEFLANRDQFNRDGIALQSGVKAIAHNIDSEVQRRRRQNAKENEWEEKKKQDKARVTQQTEDAIKMRSPQSPLALAYAAQDKIATDLAHIKNHDIPDQPEDYGLTDFFKDQWNAYFGEMNHLQAEDARGYQTRAANDRALIQAY